MASFISFIDNFKLTSMTWVFGYGSVMWKPDFDFQERIEGTLTGYHRAFNKASTLNWGSSDVPGPVLGLEEGGECTGIAFRLPDDQIDTILQRIDSREGDSYERISEEIQLSDGREISALIWRNMHNNTYLGDRSQDERLEMALNARGIDGAAKDYVLNTQNQLQNIGVEDPNVEEFAQRIFESSE